MRFHIRPSLASLGTVATTDQPYNKCNFGSLSTALSYGYHKYKPNATLSYAHRPTCQWKLIQSY
jgi:hypothetical protein